MSREEYKIWLAGLSNNMFFDECYRQVKRLYMGFDNWKLELCEAEGDNRPGDIMDLATAKVMQEAYRHNDPDYVCSCPICTGQDDDYSRD